MQGISEAILSVTKLGSMFNINTVHMQTRNRHSKNCLHVHCSPPLVTIQTYSTANSLLSYCKHRVKQVQ
uniref:Uncharacterized protein n=1 Tax=Anguilla anguilla TaxID=7936 RepID=A0A0E9Q724_ANGAN